MTKPVNLSPLKHVLEYNPNFEFKSKSQSKIVVFTSINLNYLPKALAWAKSVKQHNPQWETHILLNDAVPKTVSTWPNIDIVFPISNLDIPNFHSWVFSHNAVELCTATKPFYAKYLLDKKYEFVFYFDPDTYIYSDLNFLINEMNNCDVLITPHCAQDSVNDLEIYYNEISSLAHGIFNLGFVGFKQSPIGHNVASFWKRRLLKYCQDDHARGLFTDQKWFNLVPVYFDNVKILKHKGCNTASWNISSRRITYKNNKWLAHKNQLIFFHFSGYDKNVPREMFDIFGQFSEGIEKLILNYDKTIKYFSSTYKECQSKWIYGYYDNGKPIKKSHRQHYRDNFELQTIFLYPFYTKKEPSYYKYSSNIAHLLKEKYPQNMIKKYY